MTHGKNRLTYANAGVDIDAGNRLVDAIKPHVAKASRPGVMQGIGGFGAFFDLKAAGYADPVLVAATDGVGTKLRIAIETGRVGGIGIDLVAMCVNDLVCQGAEPLFFLDYYATGRLDEAAATEVVAGIARGCRIAGCALVGGETAEMPGMYGAGDFDLAGFAVGALERGGDLPSGVREGDVVLGLAASGVHSNGYSLVRKIVEDAGLDWDSASPFSGRTLGDGLLESTRIYTPACLAALRSGGVHALAHITGGGLTENLPRALPDGLGARVDLSAWPLPPVFAWLCSQAGLTTAEALRTFNCGIGMVAIVSAAEAETIADILDEYGETVVTLGEVVSGTGVTYRGTLE